MKIIEPKIELIEQGENIVSHVARCARVCYKREKGNDEKLVENLYKIIIGVCLDMKLIIV